MLLCNTIKEPFIKGTSRIILSSASSTKKFFSCYPTSLCSGIVPQKETISCSNNSKRKYFNSTCEVNSSICRNYSSESKIYTKTGDGGTTSLYTGERRSKNDATFNALGNMDELSSFIGFAKESAVEKNHNYVEQLERIQCILQDIGTLIATPKPVIMKSKELREKTQNRLAFNPRHIQELEDWIDQHTQSLPPLANFILPGGGRISAALHICRTVCRRAERSIVPLVLEDHLDKQVLIYINRLSDYLFTVARHASRLDGKKETIYIRPKPSIMDEDLKTGKMEVKKT